MSGGPVGALDLHSKWPGCEWQIQRAAGPHAGLQGSHWSSMGSDVHYLYWGEDFLGERLQRF